MKASISMESLWLTIQSMSLRNKEWLSSKLAEDIQAQKKRTRRGIYQQRGNLSRHRCRTEGIGRTKTEWEKSNDFGGTD